MIRISAQSMLFAVDGHFPRSRIVHVGVLQGRPLEVARQPPTRTQSNQKTANAVNSSGLERETAQATPVLAEGGVELESIGSARVGRCMLFVH